MISLVPFHTFRLKHQATEVTIIDALNQLSELTGKIIHKDFVLLGEGSNCIFAQDSNVSVFKMNLLGKEFKETEDAYIVTVKAGENWHLFVKWLMENHIYGLENLALIPGTVGAAPIQNIGAYGREVCDFIHYVEYFDLTKGKFTKIDKDHCEFGYRDSIFKNSLLHRAVVTEVTFKIPKNWQAETSYGELKELSEPTAMQIFEKVIEVRKAKLPDPTIIGNAGSFFKNPIISDEKCESLLSEYSNMPHYPMANGQVKLAAGWLIDQCGLKGFSNGHVKVHEKQALVLVNEDNNATGKDVVSVASKVIADVFKKFSVSLEPEVRFFARNGELQFRDVSVD